MQPAVTPDIDSGRIEPRFPATAVPSITSVRLSPGEGVDLVNISRSGVLVEGRTRFVPGTRVTVVFEGTFTPAQIKGRVVRCMVSSISGGALRYQSGIQFEQKLDANPVEAGDAAPVPASAPAPAPAPALAAVPARARQVYNRW